MGCRVAFAWLWVGTALAQDSVALIERVRARMRQNVERMPDYICLQTVNRSQRDGENDAFRARDVLRVEVGVSGNRELYAWPDESTMGERELAAMVGSGVVGTGNFALFAKHIFAASVAEFTAHGEETREGRRTYRFDYDVPRELSSYRLRVPPHEGITGFQGSFWVDRETLDLVRLEVRAADIPERLGVARVDSAVEYERSAVGDRDFLLPRRSELLLVTARGDQSLNRSEFTGCRQYQTSASVSFRPDEADRGAPDVPRPGAPGGTAAPPQWPIPARALIEVELAGALDPARVAAGDAIQAVVAKPVKDGERVIVPEGALVAGRVLGVERRSAPVEHYVLALQFHTLEWDGRRTPLFATMQDAGPAAGLIRREKRLEPTFTRERTARLRILVDEQRAGQGVLHWDARRLQIPKGFKSRWRVDSAERE
jgi:hypothetical protein